MGDKLADFLENAEESTFFQDIERELEIAWNKGIYGRDYIINVLGYSPKEVDSVEAYDHEADLKKAQDTENLMHHVVGYEV